VTEKKRKRNYWRSRKVKERGGEFLEWNSASDA